jgi:hypothetical protein
MCAGDGSTAGAPEAREGGLPAASVRGGRVVLLGSGVLFLSFAAVCGGQARELRVGTTVRALVAEGPEGESAARANRLVAGRLLALDDAALTLETSPESPPLAVSRQSLARLEVFRKSQRKKGALIGLGVGAATGLALNAAAASGSDEGCWSRSDDPLEHLVCSSLDETFSSPALYVTSALLIGAVGAGIGALVAPGDRWQVVRSDRLRLVVGPTHGGVRLAVSITLPARRHRAIDLGSSTRDRSSCSVRPPGNVDDAVALAQHATQTCRLSSSTGE